MDANNFQSLNIVSGVTPGHAVDVRFGETNECIWTIKASQADTSISKPDQANACQQRASVEFEQPATGRAGNPRNLAKSVNVE